MEKYNFSPQQLAVYEKTPIPLIVYQFVDNRVITVTVSEGIVSMFGLDSLEQAYEIMNHDMYTFTHPEDIAGVANAALAFATEDVPFDVLYRSLIRDEYRVIHAVGTHMYPVKDVRISVVWYVDEGPYAEGAALSFEDVRQNYSHDLRKSLATRSLHFDNLTGLPGMTYFFKLAESGLSQIQKDGYQPAIVYLNLGGIKYFNKKYGFSEGDALIRSVAKILVQHFGLDFCSRFGQDHFVVYTRLEGLEDTLRDIFDEAAELHDGSSLPIKAGIYVEPPELAEISLACDRAKFACTTLAGAYESDFAYFSDNMQISEEKRQYILDTLDRAIEENWIRPFYQPIIRAANGCVCDEEALARWIDPEKGMLSPGEFIPVLEDAMLLYKLDLHILDQILLRMKQQEEKGLYVVPVSINLSRTDFGMCDMVEEITRRVDEAGIKRELITIEITESAVGSDLDFITDQVESFQELGFNVWMDDFGSGYSSLDVLQTIHFDLIKLDMRFLQQFENNEKSRIILTELVRMIIGLGIDTVCEGVETAEQAEFLKEIGCTKLQGYHYCKPIPTEAVFERYEKGIQIGFENPAESEYFNTIGRINLYDISVMTEGDSDLQDFFDTLPMAVLETKGSIMTVSRCNSAYRNFLKRHLHVTPGENTVDFDALDKKQDAFFVRAVLQCADDGQHRFFDGIIGNEIQIHAMIRRIAVNPVTGVSSLALVILSLQKVEEDSATYAHIANSLSSDYLSLYYVDLSTEDFIEFTPSPEKGNLSLERRGKNFFSESRKDALDYIYKEDRREFIRAFSRENVLQSMDDHGTFTFTYRLMIAGVPTYVNMKAARMENDSNHIIVGVNNVDAQMRQQEALERIKDEQITYKRLMALASDFICIYTVDIETGHFMEYGATDQYTDLGIENHGENFFQTAKKNSLMFIHPDDMKLFNEKFTKDNVLKEIRENGLFTLTYRMMIHDDPQYICLKGAIVEERDGPQMVFGLINLNEQIRSRQHDA